MTDPPKRRRGRPPGPSTTRDAILAAALEEFTASGYTGASMRAIARRAGVDPALVHHYFSGKRELFMAALETHVDPADVLDYLAAGGLEELGYRIIHVATTIWESPVGRSLVAMIRSQPGTYQMMGQFMTGEILGTVSARLGYDPPEAAERLALVEVQMAGLLTSRYVLAVEPVASMPLDVLRRRMGAIVQRLLIGPLDQPPHKLMDSPSASSGRRSSVWSTRARQQDA